MQNISRRKFITLAGLAGAATLGGISAFGGRKPTAQGLTILHTNDTHSRLDPYPANHATFPKMGGYAKRAAIIKKFREEDPALLLLDAGDVFQGTPFYNMFDGEPELKLMSKMGYDAVNIGNHEFDKGLETFDRVLKYATFPFLSANYDFSETVLKGKIKPYIVLERGEKKIGIYGLGIELKGLVGANYYGNTKFVDPVKVARETEIILKDKLKCQLVICLSHLGFDNGDNSLNDLEIARKTHHTDIIIGGHSHTILDPAHVEQNAAGKPVTIGQAGSNGVYMGVMKVSFGPKDKQNNVGAYTTKIL